MKTLPIHDIETGQHSPERIQHELGQLIRGYIETRSPLIAHAVVRRIEMLCAHPAFEGDHAERCSYLRLRAHWRWLAGELSGT
jgi:hypothetical protein